MSTYFERVKERVLKQMQREYEAEKLEKQIKSQLGLIRKASGLGLCPSCHAKVLAWLGDSIKLIDRIKVPRE